LLLVGGAQAARNDALKAFAAVRGMTADIYAPALGEVTRIGELTNAYTLHLGEGLMGSLRLSAFEDYEVAHLRATVRYAAESAVPTLEPLAPALAPLEAVAQDAAADGAVVKSKRERPASDLAPTLFIGDLHLSTLKAALATHHRMASEFAGEGSLVCGTSATTQSKAAAPPGVTVRKESEGTVVIEGNVGRSFYAVRAAVYGMHARVEGA
jgi:cleavage and polyadenylation specificity factor subunit 2